MKLYKFIVCVLGFLIFLFIIPGSVSAQVIVGNGSDTVTHNTERGATWTLPLINGHSYTFHVTNNSLNGFWPAICNGTCLANNDFTNNAGLTNVNGNFGLPYTSQNLQNYPNFEIYFTNTINGPTFSAFLRCNQSSTDCSWNWILYDNSATPIPSPTFTPTPTPSSIPSPTPIATPSPTPTATPTPATIDWPVFQHDPEHSGFNSVESILKPPLNQKWQINPDSASISLNSMVVSNGTLYARSNSGFVYAIDIVSGTVKWRVQGQAGWGNLAVSNNTVYSTNWCNQCSVNAYDATNGQLKWAVGPLSAGAFGINVAGNLIYFGTSDNYIYAVNSLTGAVLWTRRFYDSIFNVPAVSGGKVYVADYQVDGRVFALDALTGNEVWRTVYQTVVGYSSPTVTNLSVFMGLSSSDHVEGYDINTGTRTWYSVPLAPSLRASTSYAYNSIFTKTTGSITQGAIVARLNPNIQSDGISSNLVWKYYDSAPVSSDAWVQPPAVVANGVVYESAANNTINAINADSGQLVWNKVLEAGVQSLIVADHTLFVGLGNGSIYAFSTQINQPPVVNPVVGSTINEGDTYLFNGSFVDTDSTSWTGTVNYGDGSGVQSLAITGTNFSLSHLYKDNGVYTVTVSITDNQGATGTATAVVTVNNVAPTVGAITVNPVGPQIINTLVNASASFADPGVLDTHTAVWNWGDGSIATSGVVTETNGSGSVTGSHTYTSAGVYTVVLTVTDKDGGVGTSQYQYVVIYDPSSGFVTGGGQVSGSQFGISAKYTANSQIPSGTVGYTFSNGTMVFASTSINWLVITGSTAFFNGVGTINGSGTYYFLVSATDGTLDMLRVKITDTLGNVIYDNQSGAAETTPPATPISNGQIKIH